MLGLPRLHSGITHSPTTAFSQVSWLLRIHKKLMLLLSLLWFAQPGLGRLWNEDGCLCRKPSRGESTTTEQYSSWIWVLQHILVACRDCQDLIGARPPAGQPTSLISRAFPVLWSRGPEIGFCHTIDHCRTILYYS